MDFFQAFWHVVNFLAPAAGTGVVAGIATKLLWRQAMTSIPVWSLCGWAVLGGVMASLINLALSLRDGTISGYFWMVLGIALALWARGLWRQSAPKAKVNR